MLDFQCSDQEGIKNKLVTIQRFPNFRVPHNYLEGLLTDVRATPRPSFYSADLTNSQVIVQRSHFEKTTAICLDSPGHS